MTPDNPSQPAETPKPDQDAGLIGELRAEIERREADRFERVKLLALRDRQIAGLESQLGELWRYVAQKHPSSKADCDHAGYAFDRHGRCCFKCGTVVTDFGD